MTTYPSEFANPEKRPNKKDKNSLEWKEWGKLSYEVKMNTINELKLLISLPKAINQIEISELNFPRL